MRRTDSERTERTSEGERGGPDVFLPSMSSGASVGSDTDMDTKGHPPDVAAAGGQAELEDARIPRNANGELTSIGSSGHVAGDCFPCGYWFKGICKYGVKCTSCHFVHEGQKSKRLRPSKHVRKRMRRAQDRQQQSENAALNADHSSSEGGEGGEGGAQSSAIAPSTIDDESAVDALEAKLAATSLLGASGRS
mmetsp:Transcript_21784/g.49586  ORF Transcript_21784/g.49586 Transcript_21784/m.49586 type:complete len:193 (-) Transcript_21784:59-637(-)